MNVTILFSLAVFSASGGVPGSETNAWIQVSEGAVGPRHSPGLVGSKALGRFVLFGGAVSHQYQGQRPYDVQTFDVASRQWFNHLPGQARSRGGETGNVDDPGYKSPYSAVVDNDGLVAPNRRRTVMWYKYAYAPWDGKIDSLVCGRTLCYDPNLRQRQDLHPDTSPSPYARSYKESLAWGAMCSDGFNKEVVLFCGCGLNTERAGPGTWVYSTEKNQWRTLQLGTQPPVRALSPMVHDPGTKKIVLFGGDRLDQLYADTWVYDCQTRTWEERRPAVSPLPRFGHALLYLTKSKTIVLLGGKGYTSSCSYCARLYRPLPLEMWTYDVSTNKWSMWKRFEQGGPPQIGTAAACAAASDDDTVLWVRLGTSERGSAGPPRSRRPKMIDLATDHALSSSCPSILGAVVTGATHASGSPLPEPTRPVPNRAVTTDECAAAAAKITVATALPHAIDKRTCSFILPISYSWRRIAALSFSM